MTINKRGFGKIAFAMLIVVGMALAPSAFARGHVSIGINLPGVSVGYWGGSRWHDHAYVGIGYSPGYYDGDYDDYYAPAPVYYDSYYAPGPVVYYSDPVYYGPTYYRGYRHEYRYYGRDRDYHHEYRHYGGDRGYYHGGRNYRAHGSHYSHHRGHYYHH